MKKPIYLGSDHNGYYLKQEIMRYLDRVKIPYKDLGNTEYQKEDDYPDYGIRVAKAVVKNKSFGVLICGSSAGVCIAANKVKGARAASLFTPKQAQQARNDDHINIACLAGWEVTAADAKKIIKTFLQTKPSKAKRHNRRVNKIRHFERKHWREGNK